MDNRLAVSNFLAKFSGVKGRILELRNKSISHRQSDSDAATLVSSEIAKISNDFEEYFEASNPDGPSIAASHLVLLEVMKHECIIALNRPLLTMPKDHPDYKIGVQLCITSARIIITTLRKTLRTSYASEMYQQQPTQLLWPSFTWAVWMSAFVIVYAAMEGETSSPAARR